MLPPVLILAVEQSDELGMRAVIVPRESDQSLHGFARWRTGEREPLLCFTELLVGLLEHAAKQLFLAAEVVIEHPIHGVRAPADALYPCAAEAVVREFLGRSLEDFALHTFRIALAATGGTLSRRLSFTRRGGCFGGGHRGGLTLEGMQRFGHVFSLVPGPGRSPSAWGGPRGAREP